MADLIEEVLGTAGTPAPEADPEAALADHSAEPEVTIAPIPEELVQDEPTRRHANVYFVGKVIFNFLLIVLGAVLIGVFLRSMQTQTAIYKQQENSRRALEEAVAIMESNMEDASGLTAVYHGSNQETLFDLRELLESGIFEGLAAADNETRAEVFADMVARSGVDYLFVMSADGRVLVGPQVELIGLDLVQVGLLTPENLQILLKGTSSADRTVTPAEENNQYGYYYWYSTSIDYKGSTVYVVLGAEAHSLELQLAALKDVSAVLGRSFVGNDGFMFAVDTPSGNFLYFHDGENDLTGQPAAAFGLGAEALEDGYAGRQTINGVQYYCVSKTMGESTVVCAVADTSKIFVNDKYVLFWSISGFVLAMIACLIYAVIVRNDFVRNAVETKKRIWVRKNGTKVIYDHSIFMKVFPLAITSVIVLFFVSFYTQTLLEISQTIERADLALEEVTVRYEDSVKSREVTQSYYDARFLAKARLIAYLLEEDPSALNDENVRYYTTYDEDGNKHYVVDVYGNPFASVLNSPRLQELCDMNGIESIYVFADDGRTIATSTPNWYFTVSHDPEDQSYPFLEVVDGKKDQYIQEPMMGDLGEMGQYIGVAFTYYTKQDEDGNTVYVSHYEFTQLAEPGTVIEHRSMLQIGLDRELTAKLLETTDLDYVFSSNMLDHGYMEVYGTDEAHTCVYSPVKARIGMTAAEIGISENAFTGDDYYSFTRESGVKMFQMVRYSGGYYIATSTSQSYMFESRFLIALITALMSLIVIIILTGTVTLTTDEEEHLYETMDVSNTSTRLDSAIFHIVTPSGNRTSTTRAASRWDNRKIRWADKSPDQKLMTMVGVLAGIMVIYILLTVMGAKMFFGDGSIIQYILSGNWERGLNIFALSACALALVAVAITVWIFKLLVRLVTPIMGARGETIGHLLLSVIKYGGAIAALFYCLYLVGVDSTSLLASAGILSLVIGLGAQSLIKDIIAGIFIVFEGEYRVGDIITIGTHRGTVMDIGLRTTKVLGMDGNVKIYNNSEISGVLNMTKEASLCMVYIKIEYGQDLQYVDDVMARELPKLAEDNPKILDGPTYRGVQELSDSGVELLITCKCSETEIKGVRRYLNREILQIFYRNNITVPFPHVTIVSQKEDGYKNR